MVLVENIVLNERGYFCVARVITRILVFVSNCERISLVEPELLPHKQNIVELLILHVLL